MSTSLSYATFFVDQFYFGIPSQDVVELTNGTEITQVPLAPASVCGLINLRGNLVPLFDVRVALGMRHEKESHAQQQAHLVLVLDKGRLAAEGPPEQALSQAVLGDVFGLAGEWVTTAHGPLLAARRRA